LNGPQPLDLDEFRSWSSAVRDADDLAGLLQNPAAERADKLDQRLLALRDDLFQLHSAFRIRFNKLRDSKEETATNYRQMHVYLASPLLPASERTALWARAHALGQKLLDDTLAEEQQHPSGASKKVPPVSPDEVNAMALDRAYRRAFFSIQLLKLAAMPVDDFPEVLTESGQKADKVDLPPLAARLREQWAEKVPVRFQTSENALFQAERLSWLLPLSVQQAAGLEDLSHWSRNPTAALKQQHVRDFWRWLGERYQAEQRALPANSVEANFFRDAAADYLRHD
jgi:hypothetical protein